jgi:integrase
MMQAGYWKGRAYKRVSVQEEVRNIGFVGWEKIVGSALLFRGATARRDRTLYAATFLTGGRISEVLSLKRDNFKTESTSITVSFMPVLKSALRYSVAHSLPCWETILYSLL